MNDDNFELRLLMMSITFGYISNIMNAIIMLVYTGNDDTNHNNTDTIIIITY